MTQDKFLKKQKEDEQRRLVMLRFLHDQKVKEELKKWFIEYGLSHNGQPPSKELMEQKRFELDNCFEI